MTTPEKPKELTEEEWILLLQWSLDNNTTIIPRPILPKDQDDEIPARTS